MSDLRRSLDRIAGYKNHDHGSRRENEETHPPNLTWRELCVLLRRTLCRLPPIPPDRWGYWVTQGRSTLSPWIPMAARHEAAFCMMAHLLSASERQRYCCGASVPTLQLAFCGTKL